MPGKLTTSPKSFRVPNSVVQGITTNVDTNLNNLNAFDVIVLFALIAHIDSNDPKREVELTLGDILEIIQVGKSVETTVERSWVNQDDETKSHSYRSRRISPAHYQRLNHVLKSLHDLKVTIRRKVKGGMTIKFVHLLHSFGYFYKQGGSKLDISQLPEGLVRYNEGSNERPLWRVRPLDPECRFLAPASVFFQLHPLLADELTNAKGTICSTVFARKIFEIFRQYAKRPSVIRLVILILRQTDECFTRNLKTVLDELGFDSSHSARAIANLREALEDFAEQKIIRGHIINIETNDLFIECNRQWFTEGNE